MSRWNGKLIKILLFPWTEKNCSACKIAQERKLGKVKELIVLRKFPLRLLAQNNGPEKYSKLLILLFALMKVFFIVLAARKNVIVVEL